MFGSSFLQSPAWEHFQQALGRKTWRVNDALVIRHDVPMGFNYLYCPRPESGIWSMEYGVWKEAREIAQKERSIFLKIDPVEDITPLSSSIRYPASSVQPRETVIVDLAQPEDALLAAMHEKMRYNIRLAERRGVITAHDAHNTTHDFEMFWRLLRETAARDGFRTHPREYYEKLLDARSDDFSNELFFAEYQGVAAAAAMVNFYRDTATYLHGASAREHRAVMAPYLLHWRIMQEAKRRGCAAYDLWGIDERRWPGLTRFKRGFGGAVVRHPVSRDIVYRAGWYALYSLWKRFSEK